MLLDRPIPKAFFYSHVRLEAKRNALDAPSCFGTDRTSTQAAAQDPLRKEGGTAKLTLAVARGCGGTARAIGSGLTSRLSGRKAPRDPAPP
jgi:hypothetical protein